MQDEHRQWRRIRTKLQNAWVALDWDQPLLRPQGETVLVTLGKGVDRVDRVGMRGVGAKIKGVYRRE